MLTWNRHHQCYDLKKEKPIREVPYRSSSYKKKSWLESDCFCALVAFLLTIILAFFLFSCLTSCEAAEIQIETIAKEASGEPFLAQVAVAEVIKTRALERGLTPAQVVKQKYQFSCNNPGVKQKPRTKKEIETAQRAWGEATATGINLYCNYNVFPKWRFSKKVKLIKQIGNLLFYKER